MYDIVYNMINIFTSECDRELVGILPGIKQGSRHRREKVEDVC
jgi:hypothetical protein